MEKKENSYGIKLIDFLFETPNNSDLKLVSSVCRAFLLLMEPTHWQLLLIVYTHKNIWDGKWRNYLNNFWFWKVMLYLVIQKCIFCNFICWIHFLPLKSTTNFGRDCMCLVARLLTLSFSHRFLIYLSFNFLYLPLNLPFQGLAASCVLQTSA